MCVRYLESGKEETSHVQCRSLMIYCCYCMLGIFHIHVLTLVETKLLLLFRPLKRSAHSSVLPWLMITATLCSG